MEIKVKLFASLRVKSPKKLPVGEAFTLKLANNSTINDLLDYLDISLEEAKIVMINHTTILEFNSSLNNGDTIAIFPPVGGG